MKVHLPFTLATHQSRTNAMDCVNLFVSSKVNYCWANKGEALALSLKQNHKASLGGMCSVMVNIMASLLQRGILKSKMGQD